MWDCALPRDLDAATLKFIVVTESYKALLDELESGAVASFRQCCDGLTPSPAHTREAREAASTPQTCMECGRADECYPGRKEFTGQHWCEPCWTVWMEAKRRRAQGDSEAGDPLEGPAVSEPAAPPLRAALSLLPLQPSSWWRHFDYVEVGTSDWGTLTQYCASDESQASWLASEIRTSLPSLQCARGLAVEAVAEYLDALPQLPMVTCVNAAMAERGGEDLLYFVSAENAERFMGQYRASMQADCDRTVDVMWFAKSLSSIGKPHPDLSAMLQNIGRQDLLETRPIRKLSWGELCQQHGLGTVDVVQLDCEGMDCAILRGLMTHCDYYPASYPRVIQFEANYLTDAQEIEKTLEALCARGYKVRDRGYANIIVER